ncbi:MAG TPA: hypothetical protein VJ227_00455 [Patescibacteria group bacterium]|nr:hypothetical protein [Patescibacteria group bacterium]
MAEKLGPLYDKVYELNIGVGMYKNVYNFFESLFNPEEGGSHIRGRVSIRKPRDTVPDLLRLTVDIRKPLSKLWVGASVMVSEKNFIPVYERLLPDLDLVKGEEIQEILKDEVLMEIYHQLQVSPRSRETFEVVPNGS